MAEDFVPRWGNPTQHAAISRSSNLSSTWPQDMTKQFRRVLSTTRMNALQRRTSSRMTEQTATLNTSTSNVFRDAPSMISRQSDTVMQTTPDTTSQLRNIPLIPTPPTDRKSLKFRTMLHSLSQTPCHWENPGLLDEALGVVPLQQIYDMAQEEADMYTAEAISQGSNIASKWGYQDCVILALMRWFRKDFFKWVNNPTCSQCRAPTIGMGLVAPVEEEQARGATRVELYQCSHANCKAFERFPRYSDAFVLLQTRRGRVGEWANCFGMLCRAIGSRVRWVWNSEDHVWTEVYSVHRKRWVHVDVCEGAWDKPLLYTQGWKGKRGYCIAFSADGAMDVTPRYVRDTVTYGAPRDKCPEAVLLNIMDEIRHLRRRNMDKKEKFRLEGEDMREAKEFNQFVIESLAREVIKLLVDSTRSEADLQKAAEQRAEVQWTRAQTEQQR